MRLRSLAVLSLCALGAEQTVFGSAFSIMELGTRAQGMAGAFTAIADDPSAIYFNPAGISFIKSTQIQADALAVVGLSVTFLLTSRQAPSCPQRGTAVW